MVEVKKDPSFERFQKLEEVANKIQDALNSTEYELYSIDYNIIDESFWAFVEHVTFTETKHWLTRKVSSIKTTQRIGSIAYQREYGIYVNIDPKNEAIKVAELLEHKTGISVTVWVKE